MLTVEKSLTNQFIQKRAPLLPKVHCKCVPLLPRVHMQTCPTTTKGSHANASHCRQSKMFMFFFAKLWRLQQTKPIRCQFHQHALNATIFCWIFRLASSLCLIAWIKCQMFFYRAVCGYCIGKRIELHRLPESVNVELSSKRCHEIPNTSTVKPISAHQTRHDNFKNLMVISFTDHFTFFDAKNAQHAKHCMTSQQRLSEIDST